MRQPLGRPAAGTGLSVRYTEATAFEAVEYSLLLQTPVKEATAMTGEITLRGKVLPVGGIKEKLLAAGRAGITTLILPRHNEKDLVEVPRSTLHKLHIVFVDEIRDAITAALGG